MVQEVGRSVNFIDLFAGIGGLSLGLERAGMTCVAQVEIDDFCQRVLAKHWPHVPKFKDVKDVGKHNLPTADLICGGFPCQPHSLAGKRKASADDRDLWGEFARIIRECQPGWVLAENVPGILSSETGRFFGRVLTDLAACGYDVEWQSLPAAAFGAPHIRERIFVVAHNASIGEGWLSVFARRSQKEGIDANGICETVSNVNSAKRETGGPPVPQERETPYATLGKFGQFPGKDNWWSTEPDVGRVVHGVPARMDRIRGLGNAVIPQAAEWIGKRIMETQCRTEMI